jgi:hypothetical protein
LTILASIPDLMIPLSAMLDTAFNSQFTSLMQTIYTSIPSQFMDLITIQASALTIYIIIRWFVGGKSK